MPCSDPTHTHNWSTEGCLTVERCEKTCGFCGKYFKHAWFTRRHVMNVHQKKYPRLMVLKGWKGSPGGNRKPHTSPEKRGRRDSISSTNRSRSVSSIGTEMMDFGTPGSLPDKNALAITNNGSFTNMMTVPFDFMNSNDLDGSFDSNLNANLDCNINVNLDPNVTSNSNSDLSTLFDEDFSFNFSTTSSFVTPQNVRTNGQMIDGIIPKPEHHNTASALADGLNNIVANVVGNGKMTAEEVVYVLETFADTFKRGWQMPMPGI